MKHPVKCMYVFLLCCVLLSCKTDKNNLTQDTTLDIALNREPKMLNPYLGPTSIAREVYSFIFVPMADFDPITYELTPILITSIPDPEDVTEGPYAGGTKYTLEFREDARWDNGSPITAKDLAFSMKAINHPMTNAASYRSYLSRVSDIQIDPDNERKIDIYFKDYYILAKELIVTLQVYPQYVYDPAGVMDQVSYRDISGPKAENKIASNPSLAEFAETFNSVKYTRETVENAGPYRLKEWIANQMIVLEKKQDYWGANSENPALQAFPEEIVFHIIPDETSALTQLKEGNIDLLGDLSSSTFLDLKSNELYKDQFQFMTEELMKYYYIAINNSKPELSDPDVRKALAKLIDVPKLIDLLENGLANPTVGIFNSKKTYYNEDLKPVGFNVEEAQTLLTKEGWEDSNSNGTIDKVFNGELVEMELDMFITGSELSKNIALLMQENAKKAGIQINIITKKYPDIKRDHIVTRDYDLVPLSLTQSLALDDPYPKWHSDNDDPSKANDVSYHSEEADALIDKIRATKDDEERRSFYMELQKVMYDDQPVIFLYNPTEKMVLSNRWKGSTTMKRPGYMANTFKPQ